MAQISSLYLVRTFQCPHCFTRYRRPVEWIGRLPLMTRIFSFRFAGLETKTLVERHQADHSNGRQSWLGRLGKWMQKLEQSAWRGISLIFLWPIRLGQWLLGGSRKSGSKGPGSFSARSSSSRRSRDSFQDAYTKRNRMRKLLKWLAGSDDYR